MYIVHKVEDGETISKIAKAFHCTTSKIKKLNGICKTITGERILIEILEGIPYTIKPFDTISKISKKFDISENEICELNGINEVFVGEIIVIPQKQTD